MEDVDLIINQPAKKSGRGLKLSPTPVAKLALDRKIKLLTQQNLYQFAKKSEKKNYSCGCSIWPNYF